MLRRSTFALSLALLPALTSPCIHVHGPGTSVWTESEHAVIVWDSKNKVEHFIREAEFESEAKDFGFMVPTPTVPLLAAADPQIFPTLHKVAEAERVRQAHALGAKAAADT